MIRAIRPNMSGMSVFVVEAALDRLIPSSTRCSKPDCGRRFVHGERYARWGGKAYCAACALALRIVRDDGKAAQVAKVDLNEPRRKGGWHARPLKMRRSNNR